MQAIFGKANKLYALHKKICLGFALHDRLPPGAIRPKKGPGRKPPQVVMTRVRVGDSR